MRKILQNLKSVCFIFFLIFNYNFAFAIELVEISSNLLPSIIPDGNLETLKSGISKEVEECKKNIYKQFLKVITIKGSPQKFTTSQWCIQTGTEILEILNTSSNFSEAYQKIRNQFRFFKSIGRDGNGTVQFTGYYSPVLNGSRLPSSTFNYPMYANPESGNQQQTQPYPDRKAIDIDRVLSGKNLEIVHVDNVFDAYVFHVQGAGSILINDKNGIKQKIFLNFSASNGHPYVSIRKILQERGVDPKYLTLPGMKKYFAEHPDEMLPTLVQNPSYVFFKEEAVGPMGATNTVLSPAHSIAIDKSIFPLSSIALVQTQKPIIENGEVVSWQSFSRLMIANDVGGAIKGAGRVDFFWGEDSYAEIAAGTMNQTGNLIFLLSKSKEY